MNKKVLIIMNDDILNYFTIKWYCTGTGQDHFLYVSIRTHVLNSHTFSKQFLSSLSSLSIEMQCLICIFADMLWQTMRTTPCWQSSAITSFWSRVRAEQEKLRPQRRFCSTMLSAVRAPPYLTLSETKCSCPIRCWRSACYLAFYQSNDTPECRWWQY